MSKMSATEARTRFGQLLHMVQTEPVHIVKNGQDAAVVVSADYYAELKAKERRALIDKLLAESVKRHGEVYKALARWEAEHEPPAS